MVGRQLEYMCALVSQMARSTESTWCRTVLPTLWDKMWRPIGRQSYIVFGRRPSPNCWAASNDTCRLSFVMFFLSPFWQIVGQWVTYFPINYSLINPSFGATVW